MFNAGDVLVITDISENKFSDFNTKVSNNFQIGDMVVYSFMSCVPSLIVTTSAPFKYRYCQTTTAHLDISQVKKIGELDD